MPTVAAVTMLNKATCSRAADDFLGIHERSDGVDGWVSLEVSPLLAHDTPRTVEQAEGLHRQAALDNPAVAQADKLL